MHHLNVVSLPMWSGYMVNTEFSPWDGVFCFATSASVNHQHHHAIAPYEKLLSMARFVHLSVITSLDSYLRWVLAIKVCSHNDGDTHINNSQHELRVLLLVLSCSC